MFSHRIPGLVMAATVIFSTPMSSMAGSDWNTAFLKSNGEWASTMLHLGDDRFFRAITSNEKGSSLRVDVLEGRCERYFLSIGANMDTSADRDLTVPNIKVEARVDRGEIHRMEATVYFERGSRFLEVSMDMGTVGPKLYGEINGGHTLRFRMVPPAAEEPIYETFSLSGSAYANSRAETLCEKYSREGTRQQSPESYFEQRPEDFFPDDGQRI